jgi:hypothetical protein
MFFSVSQPRCDIRMSDFRVEKCSLRAVALTVVRQGLKYHDLLNPGRTHVTAPFKFHFIVHRIVSRLQRYSISKIQRLSPTEDANRHNFFAGPQTSSSLFFPLHFNYRPKESHPDVMSSMFKLRCKNYIGNGGVRFRET